MTLETLAVKVLETLESSGADFMLVGAIAAGTYGVPRSTRDVDVLVALGRRGTLAEVLARLEPFLAFDAQVVFDALTWGRRHVGVSRSSPPFKVELFEMFDDAFVRSEFARRQQVFVPMLGRAAWLPTPEDIVVQKLRWGRGKDLDDARDVLAVQGPERLDMHYVQGWCVQHGTEERLRAVLACIPRL